MRLHTFNDNSAILIGANSSEVVSDRSGTLVIGTNMITVKEGEAVSLPSVSDGIKGVKLICEDAIYNAGQVNVRHSRIIAQSYMSRVEIELKHKCDMLENTVKHLCDEVVRLDKKFDNDALNFLIKGEENQ